MAKPIFDFYPTGGRKDGCLWRKSARPIFDHQEGGGRKNGRSWVKLLPVLAAAFLLLPGIVPAASAHCPLCTAGAALGVGVARAYGVDDSIVGLLLGAFVASSGLWIDKLLKRRGIEYPLQAPLLVLGSLLLLAVPLYMTGTITNVGVVRALPGYPSIFGLGALGLDKLFAGLLIGTFLVAGVFTMSDRIIEKRGGKRLFRYQGMILMAISVAIFAVILWAMTR